jgi:hypothetical protein
MKSVVNAEQLPASGHSQKLVQKFPSVPGLEPEILEQKRPKLRKTMFPARV